MTNPQAPRVVIFAGPNRAGKFTHADAIAAALGFNTFVNADQIARGMSCRNADTATMPAGRINFNAIESAGDCQARLCV